MITDEMDLDLDQDCPDFNQIKNSPSTSPVASPRSVKENSVILEARDLSSVGKSLTNSISPRLGKQLDSSTLSYSL